MSPSALVALLNAPAGSKASAIGIEPHWHAWCNGVLPSLVAPLTYLAMEGSVKPGSAGAPNNAKVQALMSYAWWTSAAGEAAEKRWLSLREPKYLPVLAEPGTVSWRCTVSDDMAMRRR